MLSAAGTVAGVALAWAGAGVLRAAMPDDIPRAASIALDLRVLLVTAGAALIVGLLVGMLPAVRHSRPNVARALSDSGLRTKRHGFPYAPAPWRPSTGTASPSGCSRSHATCSRCSRAPCIRRCTGSRRKGLLAATWKLSDTGREAKFYQLTPKGRAQLEEETANWARLSEAIGLVLRTVQQGT